MDLEFLIICFIAGLATTIYFRYYYLSNARIDKELEAWWLGKGFATAQVQQFSIADSIRHGVPKHYILRTNIPSLSLPSRHRTEVHRKVLLTSPDNTETDVYLRVTFVGRKVTDCKVLARYDL